MAGKTCVLTGATSGIGLAAASELAARGARLVLVARSPARADAALAAIRARTPRADAEVVRGDLASLAEVRSAAARVLGVCPRIDVLFNNAGVVKLSREVTADGYEATFAVNHLAYFLFTNLLLDRLRATPGARIVSTASDAHRFGGALDFGDLQSERRYRGLGVYGRSKLCNILWTRELARRLAGSGVTANCFHPGGVATRLGQTDALWTQLVGRITQWILRSPEKGAETGVWLATSPDVAGVSGRYFADRREKQPAKYAQDDAAAKRLWEISEQLVARVA
ncbi:MAG: short-chain dehydrogenase [Proteobacteria bacterium]|nr:MAG: short-chain dehydrogenase [Pseudomonadota bacterium]